MIEGPALPLTAALRLAGLRIQQPMRDETDGHLGHVAPHLIANQIHPQDVALHPLGQ